MSDKSFATANPELADIIINYGKCNRGRVSIGFLANLKVDIADKAVSEFFRKNGLILEDTEPESERDESEEDARLILTYKLTDSKKPLEQLVQRYTPKIKGIIARLRYHGGCVDNDDLMQMGYAGLMTVVNKLNAEKVETLGRRTVRGYLINSIRNYIIESYADTARIIRVSRSKLRKIKQMWSLLASYGVYIDDEKDKRVSEEVITRLMNDMGVCRERIVELFEMSNFVATTSCSLDETGSNEDGDDSDYWDSSYGSVSPAEDKAVDGYVADELRMIVTSCAVNREDDAIIRGMTGYNEDECIRSVASLAKEIGMSTYSLKMRWEALWYRILSKLLEHGYTYETIAEMAYRQA